MSDTWTTVSSPKKPAKDPHVRSRSLPSFPIESQESGQSTPWDEVTIIRKTTPLDPNDPKNSVVSTIRPTASNRQSGVNTKARSLDEETSSQPIKKISLTLGQTVAKHRVEQGLTQQQLAQKTNGKVTAVDIRYIESGKAFENMDKIVYIERALNIHLRGKHMGEPIFKK